MPPIPNADLTPNKILRIKDKFAAPMLRKAEELIFGQIIGCVFEKNMQNTVVRLSLLTGRLNIETGAIKLVLRMQITAYYDSHQIEHSCHPVSLVN